MSDYAKLFANVKRPKQKPKMFTVHMDGTLKDELMAALREDGFTGKEWLEIMAEDFLKERTAHKKVNGGAKETHRESRDSSKRDDA